MRTKAIRAAAIAAAVLAPMATLSPPALAQQSETGTAKAEEFVSKAISSGQFEIRSSEVALEKTASDDIRQFAQKMVDDHKAAAEELKSILPEAGMPAEPSASLSDEQDNMLSELESAAAEEFDALYSHMQVQAHEDAVKLFDAFSKSGAKQQLVTFASETLPTLREHLEMARKLSAASESQVGAAGQGAAGEQAAAIGGDQLIGKELQGPGGNSFGEIEDVVLSGDQVEAVVVDIGGFLGIGEKRVAIPMDRITVEGDKVASDLTEAEAEQLPDYQDESEREGQQN